MRYCELVVSYPNGSSKTAITMRKLFRLIALTQCFLHVLGKARLPQRFSSAFLAKLDGCLAVSEIAAVTCSVQRLTPFFLVTFVSSHLRCTYAAMLQPSTHSCYDAERAFCLQSTSPSPAPGEDLSSLSIPPGASPSPPFGNGYSLQCGRGSNLGGGYQNLQPLSQAAQQYAKVGDLPVLFKNQ